MQSASAEIVTSRNNEEHDDNHPECPLCGCLMDKDGKSFASKNLIQETEYFCNNPICSK